MPPHSGMRHNAAAWAGCPDSPSNPGQVAAGGVEAGEVLDDGGQAATR
jgi:hypothetical protein